MLKLIDKYPINPDNIAYLDDLIQNMEVVGTRINFNAMAGAGADMWNIHCLYLDIPKLTRLEVMAIINGEEHDTGTI